MSLNSVSGKSYFFEKINRNAGKNKKPEGGFTGNLKEMSVKGDQENATAMGGEQDLSTSLTEYYYGKTAKEIWVEQSGRVGMRASFECGARFISSAESDCVEVNVIKGYTLKAKVFIDEHKVYVEQKNEDGSSMAYEVNPLLIPEDTENPVEKIAAKAWEEAKQTLNDGMVSELEDEENVKEEEGFGAMLMEFHAFVKKRIKEGAPKIQIGASFFSEKEWKQLLKKIDKDIDAYKEELRQRVKKRDKAAAAKQASGIAAEAFGQNPANEMEKASLTSEQEAIKGAANTAQKGNGFLARLSGVKRAPYSYLQDETGNITYNGVTFICDDKKQQICLGDMSNPNNVLNIPLSKGGLLRVNRDNIGDLVKAIDMFSPEDIAKILQAIAKDKKIQEVELEVEAAHHKNPSK